ncbi:MAG TPA: ABC transporter substrate-binding protein [Burkholderiales bacterium]|nr:ABC transporter substrate-binding protein [Burkholderiales bacterium]
MTRLHVLAAWLALSIAATPWPALAQQKAKVWRLGYLGDGSAAVRAGDLRQFRLGMAELGYVEGRNLVMDVRWTEADPDGRSRIANEFVKADVDVIVTHGAQAALAAKAATQTIPIVVAVSSDFIANGLVRSLARPGGNLTGLTDQVADLAAKEVQLLKEALPKLQLAGVLWDSDNPNANGIAVDTQDAARKLGLRLLLVPLKKPSEIGKSFEVLTTGGAGAVIVIHSPLTVGNRAQIAEFALNNRMAMIGAPVQFSEAGALLSYGPDLPKYFRYAAVTVDKILKGAKPGDVPIEQPLKFEFVINLNTAQALGIEIPRSLLMRADRLIGTPATRKIEP